MTDSAQTTANTTATNTPVSSVSNNGSQFVDSNNQENMNLEMMDEIINELQSTTSQAIIADISKADNNLNPNHPVKSSRERAEGSLTAGATSIDAAVIDLGGGVQTVEYEVNPEIPVEVESFLHRVEDNLDQAPDEIVIADGTVETVKANYPSTPVVVLPITQEEQKEGQKKAPIFSIRWLVELSQKVIKMFAGKVIYAQKSSSPANGAVKENALENNKKE